MSRASAVLVLVALVVFEPLAETARAETAEAKGEVAAIRAAAGEYLAALARDDADALSQAWTPEGDYVDASGKRFNARELIARRAAEREKQPAGSGAPRSEKVALPESTVRLVTPEVGIEDGTTNASVDSDGRPIVGRFSAVWVKRDGCWRLDSLRETVAESPAEPGPLQPLEWLIGEWVGTTGDSTILVSSRWSDAGHYILREFAERGRDGGVVTGSQRIGWDPATKKIKCWTFDSQGGHGEGVWRRDGDRWIIDIKETMPDGTTATFSTTHIPSGEGRFVWEASGGKVGDENVPTRRVEFKRAAER